MKVSQVTWMTAISISGFNGFDGFMMNMQLPIRSGKERGGGPADRRPPRWLNASPGWTTKPPTEPGWYWAILVDTSAAQMAELTPSGEFRIGDDEIHPATDFTSWLGPQAIRAPRLEYEALPWRPTGAD